MRAYMSLYDPELWGTMGGALLDVCLEVFVSLGMRMHHIGFSAPQMAVEYLPEVCAAFPRPPEAEDDPADVSRSRSLHRAYHDFKPDLPPALVKLYPSHLHIDLMPHAQGQGHGTALIQHQLAALRGAGSVGVHLGMAASNIRAYRFYKKMGFHELLRIPGELILGMRLRTAAPAPPVPLLTGVIEGFYGRPWSQPQRLEAVEHLADWRMDLYMYGPKDDRKHRHAWRELYDEEECVQLRELAAACSRRGIGLVYACGPGLDMVMSDTAEHEKLHAKLDQVAACGVTGFALLFDDIPDALCAADAAAFASQAEAHCAVANHAFMHLLDAGTDLRLFFCPTEYCGAFAEPDVGSSPYLRCVGAELLPEAGVFWTGPDIISAEITVAHVKEVGDVLRRRPMLWDNLHANDYDNGRRLYLGPYS